MPESTSKTSLSSSSVTSGGCRLGFIGTGTIASAIATGLATQSAVSINSICVTERSQAKSTALAKSFPDLVSVHGNNQDVLDRSDIIFITVLPKQTKEVLEQLKFDPDRHILVSLVSTSKLPSLVEDSGLSIESTYKMICLPAVSSHDGVCTLLGAPSEQRKKEELLALLETLGGVVEAQTEEEMSVMMVPSGLMGSFYGILRNNRDWLVRKGIPLEKANFLIVRQYHSMMVDAERHGLNPTGFEELIKEQTPGGLNEQALKNLSVLGALADYDKIQDAMLERILGISDGSLKQE